MVNYGFSNQFFYNRLFVTWLKKQPGSGVSGACGASGASREPEAAEVRKTQVRKATVRVDDVGKFMGKSRENPRKIAM